MIETDWRLTCATKFKVLLSVNFTAVMKLHRTTLCFETVFTALDGEARRAKFKFKHGEV